MKCLRCAYDSKYKDRGGKICPACKGRFAFEPQLKDPFTDVAFDAAIKRVSAQGRVKWGAEHLYYELCRMQAKRATTTGVGFSLLGLGGVLGGGATMAAELAPLLGVGGAVAAVIGVGVLLNRPKSVRLTWRAFEQMWNTWKNVHGVPKGLIERRPAPAGPKKLEADIPEYSFDRAVICDRARTVDLLLANDFHLENNCAVLSVEGYPVQAFATVLAMLKRNPRLVVFALHDATPRGCLLAHTLASDPKWFKGQGRVIDLGLSTAHARKMKGLWIEPAAGKVPDALGAEDKAFLSKWNVELAAVRPEQVVKRLFKAVAAYQEGVAPVSDAGWTTDVVIFGSDAGVSDGGGDSFG